MQPNTSATPSRVARRERRVLHRAIVALRGNASLRPRFLARAGRIGVNAPTSVIIPTIASPERADALRRAIASVLKQVGAKAQPVVVVNGARFDAQLVRELRDDPRVTVLQFEEGNVSRARFEGARHAKTETFCFLDDDDELTPRSVRERLDAFGPDVDVVVCNGVFHLHGVERIAVPRAVGDRINADPLGTLMAFNWFCSPSAMFRASTVPASLFDFRRRFFECTWMALKLLEAHKRFAYVDVCGFRIHQSTSDSAHSSKEYARALPEFMRELRALRGFGVEYTRAVADRKIRALNQLSRLEMGWGNYGRAWATHLRCLTARGGLRYLPYTRHLLVPTGIAWPTQIA
jgi:glycosyltransferase involved in cell wall biosynthesis